MKLSANIGVDRDYIRLFMNYHIGYIVNMTQSDIFKYKALATLKTKLNWSNCTILHHTQVKTITVNKLTDCCVFGNNNSA